MSTGRNDAAHIIERLA